MSLNGSSTPWRCHGWAAEAAASGIWLQHLGRLMVMIQADCFSKSSHLGLLIGADVQQPTCRQHCLAAWPQQWELLPVLEGLLRILPSCEVA